MIDINTINGELKFEKWFFSQNKRLKDYLTLFHSGQVEPWVVNKNWKSYRLIFEYFILIMYFNDEILYMIEVCPIPKNNKNDDEISLLLENLGGENVYPWGSVEFSNDIKAGAKSVLVKYN